MPSRHSDSFKRDAVRKARARAEGVTIGELAKQFGVAKSALYRWLQLDEGEELADEEPEETEEQAEDESRPAYEGRGKTSELDALRAERDRLLADVEALRKTIVLLGTNNK
jgi:transposase-like protein